MSKDYIDMITELSAQITEAVAKVLAEPAGNKREQKLDEIIDLFDKARVRADGAYINLVRAYALVIEENRELRAELQRLQSAAAVRVPA